MNKKSGRKEPKKNEINEEQRNKKRRYKMSKRRSMDWRDKKGE